MKKQIMKRAWEIAREAVSKFGGNATEYFAEALRMAWKETKIAVLEEKGFKRWQKGNMDRLYVNAPVLGLQCEYYKTGNIYRATFQGSLISNCEAYRIKSAKTYIDVKTWEVFSDHKWCKEAAAQLAGIRI